MGKYDNIPSGLKAYTYDGYSRLFRFDTRPPEIIMRVGFSGTASSSSHSYRPFQESTVYASASLQGIYYFRDLIKLTIQDQQLLFPDEFIRTIEANIDRYGCYGFLYRINIFGIPTLPLYGRKDDDDNYPEFITQLIYATFPIEDSYHSRPFLIEKGRTIHQVLLKSASRAYEVLIPGPVPPWRIDYLDRIYCI